MGMKRKKRNPFPFILIIAVLGVGAYLVFFSGGGQDNATGDVVVPEGPKLVAYNCPADEVVDMAGTTVLLKGFTKVDGEVACRGFIQFNEGESLEKCNPVEVHVFPKTKEVRCEAAINDQTCKNYCEMFEKVVGAGSTEAYLEQLEKDPECYMVETKQKTEDFGDHTETMSFIGKKDLDGQRYCYSTITSEPDVSGCGIIELYSNPLLAEIKCRYTGEGEECDLMCYKLEMGIGQSFCEGIGDLARYSENCKVAEI